MNDEILGLINVSLTHLRKLEIPKTLKLIAQPFKINLFSFWESAGEMGI